MGVEQINRPGALLPGNRLSQPSFVQDSRRGNWRREQDQMAGDAKTTKKRKAPASSTPPISATTASTPHTTKKTNPYDSIRHCIVTNDGKHDSVVKLIGLKSLFAKQLPKMPKEYIVRLVFDRRHRSLALLSKDPDVKGSDDEIIGGICYRSYPEMRFAEIAFCAISASQQVKVGTHYIGSCFLNQMDCRAQDLRDTCAHSSVASWRRLLLGPHHFSPFRFIFQSFFYPRLLFRGTVRNL